MFTVFLHQHHHCELRDRERNMDLLKRQKRSKATVSQCFCFKEIMNRFSPRTSAQKTLHPLCCVLSHSVHFLLLFLLWACEPEASSNLKHKMEGWKNTSQLSAASQTENRDARRKRETPDWNIYRLTAKVQRSSMPSIQQIKYFELNTFSFCVWRLTAQIQRS